MLLFVSFTEREIDYLEKRNCWLVGQTINRMDGTLHDHLGESERCRPASNFVRETESGFYQFIDLLEEKIST